MADNGNGLSFTWRNTRVDVRGIAVIFLVGVAAVVASNYYIGQQITQALRDHDAQAVRNSAAAWRAIERIEIDRQYNQQLLARRLDMTNCVTLFDFTERKYFRQFQDRGSWDKLCPWITPEPSPPVRPSKRRDE